MCDSSYAPSLSTCNHVILLPFYEDPPSCKRLLNNIHQAMDPTMTAGNDVFILIVDDGSLTHTIGV